MPKVIYRCQECHRVMRAKSFQVVDDKPLCSRVLCRRRVFRRKLENERWRELAKGWHWLLPLVLLALAPPAHATNPRELTLEDRADVVEVNHFYDEQGRLVFDQEIWWDWSPIHERHECRAWRLIKCPAQLPVPDHEQGGYVATWLDGDVVRMVRATSYRRTYTQHGYAGDPEQRDLEVLPKERRRELRTVKVDRPSGVEQGNLLFEGY